MYAQAEVSPGSWTLPKNDVWNVPEEDLHFKVTPLRGAILNIRGLAVTKDGKIYGLRTMNRPSEDGYVLRGRVSIEGRKVNAFTSSRIFQREDGSLVEVAILYLCT